jgi:hypothetical protein
MRHDMKSITTCRTDALAWSHDITDRHFADQPVPVTFAAAVLTGRYIERVTTDSSEERSRPRATEVPDLLQQLVRWPPKRGHEIINIDESWEAGRLAASFDECAVVHELDGVPIATVLSNHSNRIAIRRRFEVVDGYAAACADFITALQKALEADEQPLWCINVIFGAGFTLDDEVPEDGTGSLFEELLTGKRRIAHEGEQADGVRIPLNDLAPAIEELIVTMLTHERDRATSSDVRWRLTAVGRRLEPDTPERGFVEQLLRRWNPHATHIGTGKAEPLLPTTGDIASRPSTWHT